MNIIQWTLLPLLTLSGFKEIHNRNFSNIYHINPCCFLSGQFQFMSPTNKRSGCETDPSSEKDTENKTQQAKKNPKIELFKWLNTRTSHSAQTQQWRRFLALAGCRLEAQQRPLVADWWTVFFLWQRLHHSELWSPPSSPSSISLLSPHCFLFFCVFVLIFCWDKM